LVKKILSFEDNKAYTKHVCEQLRYSNVCLGV